MTPLGWHVVVTPGWLNAVVTPGQITTDRVAIPLVQEPDFRLQRDDAPWLLGMAVFGIVITQTTVFIGNQLAGAAYAAIFTPTVRDSKGTQGWLVITPTIRCIHHSRVAFLHITQTTAFIGNQLAGLAAYITPGWLSTQGCLVFTPTVTAAHVTSG